MLFKYIIAYASLITAARAGCGVPVVSYPADGDVITSNRVTYKGYSTDPACLKMLIYLDSGSGYEQLAGAGPSNAFSRSETLAWGTHTLYIAATGVDASNNPYPQVKSTSITFTLKPPPHVCSTPVLNTPISGAAYTKLSIGLGGYSTDPLCSKMQYYIDDQLAGSVDLAGTGSANPFYQKQTLTAGTHTLYLASTGVDASGAALPITKSSPVSFVVRDNYLCSSPVITSPTAGLTLTDTVVKTIFYSTDPVCQKMLVYIDGKAPDRLERLTGVGSANAYTRSYTLAAGTHTLRIAATDFDTNGNDYALSYSPTVTFTVNDKHVCAAPTLVSPSAGALFTSQTVTSKFYSNDPLCQRIIVYYDDISKGLENLAGTGLANAYTRQDTLSTRGSHTLRIAATGTDSSGSDYDLVYAPAVTFKIDDSHVCGVPVLTSPISGATLRSLTVASSGYTVDPLCPKIFLWLDGGIISSRQLAGAGSANGFSRTDDLKAGTHQMWVSVTGPDSTSQDLPQVASTPITFTIDVTHVCSVPILTAPTAGSTSDGLSITYSGYTIDPLCNKALIYLDNQVMGFEALAGAGLANTFSRSKTLTAGSHTMYISVNGIDSNGKEHIKANSAPVTFTVAEKYVCTLPVLTSPIPGDILTTNPVTTSYYLTDPRCPKVTIYLDNSFFASQTFQSQYNLKWSQTDKFYAGDHTMYLSVTGPDANGNDMPAVRSAPVSFTFKPSTVKCQTPIITSPSADSTQSQYRLSIVGTFAFSTLCNSVAIYIDGAYQGTAYSSGDRFNMRPLDVSKDGSYNITAVVQSSQDHALDSLPASQTLNVKRTRCPPPTIGAPLDNSAINTLPLSISGSVSNNPECSGLVYTVNGVSSNTLGFNIYNLKYQYTSQAIKTDGSYSISVVSKSQVSSDYDSLPVISTVRYYAEPCPAPVLISPKAGETSTTNIYFSGTVDNRPECGQIQVYMDGVLIYSTASTGKTPPTRRKRAAQFIEFNIPTSDLAPGPHNIYAVVTGLNNGTPTESIPIVVAPNNGATPTVFMGKRKRNRCSVTETLCTFTQSGRVGFECIADVDSNMERCGACDGPDCSEIANASIVACREGQCVVTSCAEGYKLEDNICVAEFYIQA